MSEGKLFDVRCEECNYSAQKTRWNPGAKCPQCGSEKYYPDVVTTGGTKAPDALTAEDVRFGRLAKWARFVRSAQLEECRAEQKNAIKKGGPIPSLSEVMVKKGYLAEEQIDMILRLQEAPLPTTDETQFLQTARLNSFITQEQLAECANLQTKMIITGKRVVPIIDILLEKGYLNEDQVGAILRAQRVRQRGLLSALDAEWHGVPHAIADTAAADVAKGFKEFNRSAWRKNPVIVLVALVVVLAVSYMAAHRFTDVGQEEKPQGMFKCEACGNIFTAPLQQTPVRCPSCKEAKALYYLRCPRCAGFYTASAEDFAKFDRCPDCRAKTPAPQ